jgi:hypothetical protein
MTTIIFIIALAAVVIYKGRKWADKMDAEREAEDARNAEWCEKRILRAEQSILNMADKAQED